MRFFSKDYKIKFCPIFDLDSFDTTPLCCSSFQVALIHFHPFIDTNFMHHLAY